MKLTVTTLLSLDGVVQAPGGPDEDRTGGFARGGWAVPFDDAELRACIAGVFAEADAFLLGRVTYEDWAAYWPKLGDTDPVASALNSRPKHVASRTLTSPEWPGTSVLSGDLAESVRALTARPGRELQVHGSSRLAQALARHGLVDTYRLLVFPVLVGSGKRLFEPGAAPAAFRLAGHSTTAAGVRVQTYERSYGLGPSMWS